MTLEELSFEQAFEQLQTAIQRLEDGGLTLEESIAQFELGTRLAALCTEMLDRAELRVSRLMAGQATEEPMAVALSEER
ncbi:MAG TPA: exodeoxyribonuclease VII small subunit [Chloroflexota bacterium]